MFFIVAILVGILLGLLVPYTLSSSTLPYLAVAIIAALDSVFGGLLAYLNKRFNINVFMIGLVSNAILAVFLTFIGNILGISLSFAVIVVFGVRMFNNMASIRRLTFDVYFVKRAKEKERENRLKLEAALDAEDQDDIETETDESSKDEETEEDSAENVEVSDEKEEK